jgi:hypothetical protein
MGGFMRHKWDSSFWKSKGYSTCIRCGVVKENQFPLLMYFNKDGKFLGNKANECKLNKPNQ